MSVARPDVAYYETVAVLRRNGTKVTDKAVAAELAVDRTTVGRWRKRFKIPPQR